MVNDKISKPENQKYDLEERTVKFGEDVIDFMKELPKNEITRPLIRQAVRSGTGIGANYVEANQASSKKDFRNKIYIAKKEASETMYWLRIIVKSCPDYKESARKLWQEAKEFTLIFSKITTTLNKRKTNL